MLSKRGFSSQLQRHSRRLQADAAASTSVDASYDVVTTDPLVANDLLEVTADPTAFAETLVTTLNSAGTALPTLDTSQVSVAPPTVTTDISYVVVIESQSASTTVEAVTQRLEQPAIMAQALSAATGTTVRNEDVQTTAQPVAGADVPGGAAQGEHGGSLTINIEINTIITIGAAAVLCCVTCYCIRCCKRRVTARKRTAGAEQTYNPEREWIVEAEQLPGHLQPVQQGETIVVMAEPVRQSAQALVATAPTVEELAQR